MTSRTTSQAERNEIARRATGPVYVSHSAPLADGTVEWFIVKAPDGDIELLSTELDSLRKVGRAVIAISHFPNLYAKVIS
jgi:hypothetical protein